MELKSFSKSSSILHVHLGLLPKDQDGMSEIAFHLPLMCIGLSRHACWVFSRSARACIWFLAIIDLLDASCITHPTVGELLLNSVMRFLQRSLHTPSIMSHSMSRPAISRSKFDIFPFGFYNVFMLFLMSFGHSHRNTVGVHADMGVVFLVLDSSSFCVSRTKNGEEKCECESKWRGRREVGV